MDIELALTRWYPILFENKDTHIIEMLADPLKKSIIDSIVLLFLLIIILFIDNKFNMVDIYTHFRKNNQLYIVIIVIIILVFIIFLTSFMKQNYRNKNIISILKNHNNVTKLNYESIINNITHKKNFMLKKKKTHLKGISGIKQKKRLKI